jgi:hypothetical protein
MLSFISGSILMFIHRVYYLIEYDVDLKHPEVSDYHIYRFR